MALAEALPYGIRDIKLRPLSAGGTTLGTAVDLPNARTLSFEEAEEFETLRGDDQDVATRGRGASVAWTLEAGGISLEALVVINGGTVTTTGITPAQKKTYRKLVTDARPEFQAEGQAMSESGGDFHTILFRCKASENVTGEFSDGAFFLTGAGGNALPGKTTGNIGALYDFVHNETATAIVTV
jgi:hypothetical protein